MAHGALGILAIGRWTVTPPLVFSQDQALAASRTAPCTSARSRFFGWTRNVVNVFKAATADSTSVPLRSLSGDGTGLCDPRDVAADGKGELYVLNGNIITVYSRDAAGDATPIRAIDVRNPGLNDALGIGLDRRGNIYVGTNDAGIVDSGSIAVFAPGATGEHPPGRLLRGPHTSLRRPRAIAVDDEGLIYATTGDSILIFSRGTNGDVSPIRRIAGGSTGLDNPIGLAVDHHGFLYAANANGKSVTVYAPGSAGDQRPLRVIESDSFARGGPTVLAVDDHDTLYVAARGNILVYSPGAEQSSLPVRTIARMYGIRSLAVSREGRLYVALEMGQVWIFQPGATDEPELAGKISRGNGDFDPSGVAFGPADSLYVADARSNSVRVYPPGVPNDTAPARRITGPNSALSDPFGIAVDRRGRLYVTNAPLPKTSGAIRVYAPTADADASPIRVLNGPSAVMGQPMDVAFDGRGDMYVLNWGSEWSDAGSDRINVFRGDADGDAAPIRTIKGPNTLLRHPIKFAFGRNDTLYVLNAFHLWKYGTENVTITVYAPRVSGDVEPVRSIIVTGGRHSAGGSLGLIWPTGIAVDARGSVYLANYWARGVVAVFAPGASGPVRPSRLVYPRSADSAKVWPGLGAVAVTVGPRDELFVAASPQPTAFTMR
jgi:sugar lactone lactonase YvrE